MGIALYHSGVEIAEENRSQIPGLIVSEWARWKLHQAGPTASEFVESRGTDAGLQDLTIIDYQAGNWSTNPGWFTPVPALYQSARSANFGDADTLLALDTCTGGVFICAEVDLVSNPTGGATEAIFHYGTNGSGGQYGLSFQYGTNLNYKPVYQEIGGTLTNPSTNLQPHIGKKIIVAAYFDVANDNIIALSPTSPGGTVTAMNVDGTARPGTTTDLWQGLLARPLAADQQWGRTGAGNLVRDIFVLRSQSDISGQIAGLYAEFDANRTEYPWGLVGL